MAARTLLLIGCGILHKEIRLLIDKNRWPVDTCFLDSALHINFEKLADQLGGALARYRHRHCIVFYGGCHPLMEAMLEKGPTFRTDGQNCVDILLGHALFTAELQNGAFFLMEDWARRWGYITRIAMGRNLSLIRDIYQGAHAYLLSLRTPCSGDFRAAAEGAGRMVGLPVRWLDVGLDNLEAVLQETINRKLREIQ
jgi:hypothetical protein